MVWHSILSAIVTYFSDLLLKPGVDDPGMEHLIQDKVDTFWRAIQTDTDRRGQVRLPHVFNYRQSPLTYYP